MSVADRTPVLMFMQQALYPRSHLPGLRIIKAFKKVKAEHEPKRGPLLKHEPSVLHGLIPQVQPCLKHYPSITRTTARSHRTGPALTLHDLLARALCQPAASILQTHYVSPPCRTVLQHRPLPPLPMPIRSPCWSLQDKTAAHLPLTSHPCPAPKRVCFTFKPLF